MRRSDTFNPDDRKASALLPVLTNLGLRYKGSVSEKMDMIVEPTVRGFFTLDNSENSSPIVVWPAMKKAS